VTPPTLIRIVALKSSRLSRYTKGTTERIVAAAMAVRLRLITLLLVCSDHHDVE